MYVTSPSPRCRLRSAATRTDYDGAGGLVARMTTTRCGVSKRTANHVAAPRPQSACAAAALSSRRVRGDDRYARPVPVRRLAVADYPDKGCARRPRHDARTHHHAPIKPRRIACAPSSLSHLRPGRLLRAATGRLGEDRRRTEPSWMSAGNRLGGDLLAQ